MLVYSSEIYKTRLMYLWKQCFPQVTNLFTQFYFDEIYKNNETLVYLEEDQPVAALQMIPYTVQTGAAIHSAGYLSGIMTHPKYRNKGYMAQLLYKSFDEMVKKGYDYTFLIPQDQWLQELYAKYDFQSVTSLQSTPYGMQDVSGILYPVTYHLYTASCHLYPIYSRLLREKGQVVLKTERQFQQILLDFFDEKGVLFANEQGMAFTLKESEKILLKEFFYPNEAVRAAFLREIHRYYGMNTMEGPDEAKGMIKRLNPLAEEITGLYLGMMLD